MYRYCTSSDYVDTVHWYFVRILWSFHVVSCCDFMRKSLRIFFISGSILSGVVVACTGAAGGVGEEAQVPRLSLPRPAAHQLQQSHPPAPPREGEGQLS
jgi:hypothetical protein